MSGIAVQVHRDALPDGVAAGVADLHAEVIVDGFLSSLGRPFLEPMYSGLARARCSFVITAHEGSELVGFVCAATDTRRAYLQFARTRSGLRAVRHLVPRLASIKTVRRVVETLLYPAKSISVNLPRAEILNFCVSPRRQGRGVGQQLFAALEIEFARRGVAEIRIVTGGEQRSAHRFYDRVGASRATELQVHQGTTSIVYTYPIAARSQHPDV